MRAYPDGVESILPPETRILAFTDREIFEEVKD
jgi:hypothetical protein